MNTKNGLIVFILLAANIATLATIKTRKNVEKAPVSNEFNESFSADPFIGEIILFAGNFAPRGWALCDGQLLPIAQNTALFSIIGTTYGGDGENNFALPDLRSRVAVHEGSGPGLSQVNLGQRFGQEQMNLTLAQLPAHSHSATLKLKLADGLATTNDGIDNYLAVNTGTAPIFSDNTSTSTNSADMLEVNTSTIGGNTPFSLLQPSLGLNYIIALQGFYPSQN